MTQWYGAIRTESGSSVMLYWLIRTAGSSANHPYEVKLAGEWPERSGVPTGVAVFAENIAIRRYAEQSTTSSSRACSFDREDREGRA